MVCEVPITRVTAGAGWVLSPLLTIEGAIIGGMKGRRSRCANILVSRSPAEDDLHVEKRVPLDPERVERLLETPATMHAGRDGLHQAEAAAVFSIWAPCSTAGDHGVYPF